MSQDEPDGIGVGGAAALVAGSMIGAGVFTTSGFALADLGSRGAVLLAWAVGGLIACCGALSYAALSARISGNGGEYLFLSRAVHPLAGFLAGWVSMLAGFTAPIAVAAHGLEAYARGAVDFGGPPGVLGAGAILLTGWAHGLARRSGMRFQSAAVVLQVVSIVGFILVGAFAGGFVAPSIAEPTPVSISSFAVTLVWVSFAYSGWNAAVYVAAELRDSRRTLPRATLLGTLGVVALYLALNAVFLYSGPIELLSGKAEIGAIAAEQLAGPMARRVLSGIVALGLLTSISAMVMVGPRVYAQMADDGVLPRALAARKTSPRRAIVFQVLLALMAFFIGELRDLLLYVGFLLGLSSSATVACLFFDWGDDAAGSRPGLRHPWVPVVFVAATLGSVAFMIVSEPGQAAAGVLTLGVGGAVYGWTTRSARRREGPSEH